MNKLRFVQKTVVLHPEFKDKFLVLTRALDDKSRPGDFDLPGGSVSLEELHEDALRREVLEETTLEIEDIRPVIVKSDVNTPKQLYWLYIGYIATAKSSNVVIDYKEHCAFSWMTLQEFKNKAGDHLLLKHIETAIQ